MVSAEMGPHISSIKMCRVQPDQWPARPAAKKSFLVYFFACTASWIHSHSRNNCKWLLLHTSTLFIHAPISLFVSTNFSAQSLVVLRFSRPKASAVLFMMGMHVFRTSTSQFWSFLPVDPDRVMTDEPMRAALECAALGSQMWPLSQEQQLQLTATGLRRPMPVQ
jgi:hypothetical protein